MKDIHEVLRRKQAKYAQLGKQIEMLQQAAEKLREVAPLLAENDDDDGAILLDADGRSFDSNAFAKWLGELRDRGTRQVIFICGNADGFPESLRERVSQRISLSAMTLSHELARAVLAEQIYRAFAILSGSPYPK